MGGPTTFPPYVATFESRDFERTEHVGPEFHTSPIGGPHRLFPAGVACVPWDVALCELIAGCDRPGFGRLGRCRAVHGYIDAGGLKKI